VDLYEEYNRTTSDVAAKHGAYLLDLHNILSRLAVSEPAPLLAEDGVHLTPDGEYQVAVSVLQALETLGLPGSEPYRQR
jgi:lysophospholipase L1-like esterase